MKEVFFLEREKRKYGIKVSNERIILKEGSLERTILIKSIDSFDVLDNKWAGIIWIILGILFLIALIGLIFLVIGILCLTRWRFYLKISTVSGKIEFPISYFGNNYEIIEAIKKAILYKPNGSEKLMNNPAASGVE
jgi:hypothetical protein